MRLKHDNKHIYHWHTHTHKTKTSNQIDWHLPKKKVKPKTQEMNWQLNKLAEHLSVFSNFIRHLLVFTILYLSAMKVKSENCFPTTFEQHVNIVCVLLQFHQSSLSFCVSVDCNGTGLLHYQSINHKCASNEINFADIRICFIVMHEQQIDLVNITHCSIHST